MSHHEPQKLGGDGFSVVGPFEDGHVLSQVLFMDAPKRPEEISQPRPDTLHSMAVHFSHSISIIISGILPLRMTYGVLRTARFTHRVVGRGLVRRDCGGATRCVFHFGRKGLLLRVLTHR